MVRIGAEKSTALRGLRSVALVVVEPGRLALGVAPGALVGAEQNLSSASVLPWAAA